jgi:hypothetical protein
MTYRIEPGKAHIAFTDKQVDGFLLFIFNNNRWEYFDFFTTRAAAEFHAQRFIEEVTA